MALTNPTPKNPGRAPVTSHQHFLLPQSQFASHQFLTWRTSRRQADRGIFRYSFRMARYALFHGLRALGLARGDEVLVPAYICDAAVQAIEACGATPVFFRITRSCSLDLQDLARRISPRTKAVVAIHYFGFSQDLKELETLCIRHRLLLVEDCAHVFQSKAEGKPLGSIGDISVFSWRKFLPVSDGGELVINSGKTALDAKLHHAPLVDELKSFKYFLDTRSAGRKTIADRALRIPGNLRARLHRNGNVPSVPEQAPSATEPNGSAFEDRLADSRISRVSQFVFNHSNLRAITEKRRQNYLGLEERLSHILGVVPLWPRLPDDTCPLYFPLFCGNEPGAHRRLRAMGVPATAWDGVRPRGISDDRFPDAGFLYENLMFLPVHQCLREIELDLIAHAVKKVAGDRMNIAAASPRK